MDANLWHLTELWNWYGLIFYISKRVTEDLFDTFKSKCNMYVELKFYRSSDMFKVASEEYLSEFH